MGIGVAPGNLIGLAVGAGAEVGGICPTWTESLVWTGLGVGSERDSSVGTALLFTVSSPPDSFVDDSPDGGCVTGPSSCAQATVSSPISPTSNAAMNSLFSGVFHALFWTMPVVIPISSSWLLVMPT